MLWLRKVTMLLLLGINNGFAKIAKIWDLSYLQLNFVQPCRINTLDIWTDFLSTHLVQFRFHEGKRKNKKRKQTEIFRSYDVPKS